LAFPSPRVFRQIASGNRPGPAAFPSNGRTKRVSLLGFTGRRFCELDVPATGLLLTLGSGTYFLFRTIFRSITASCSARRKWTHGRNA
jgi:hypothetical protein